MAGSRGTKVKSRVSHVHVLRRNPVDRQKQNTEGEAETEAEEGTGHRSWAQGRGGASRPQPGTGPPLLLSPTLRRQEEMLKSPQEEQEGERGEGHTGSFFPS